MPVCTSVRLNGARFGLAALIAVVASACSADPTPTSPTLPTTASLARSTQIRVVELDATGIESEAFAVNASGDAVGRRARLGVASEAVLWRDGQTILVAPNALMSDANGINKFGEVVGYQKATAIAPSRGFVWRNGTLSDLGTLGGDGTSARSINDRGQIVGYSSLPTSGTAPFIWDDGAMRNLGRPFGFFAAAFGINRRGEAVGYVQGNEAVAHHWADGQAVELPDMGGIGSIAFDINASGQIVGMAAAPSGAEHALLWEGGELTDLGTLPGMNSARAHGINSRGDIVGYAYHTSNRQVRRAVLWTDGTILDLGTLGGASGFAWDINDHGVVVGWSLTASGQQHATMWIVGSKGR